MNHAIASPLGRGVSDDAPQREAEWTDPDRGKVLLGDYARTWIKERPGLRPKTLELYTWLLERHIVPGLGEVPGRKLTTALIRSWRAALIDKAYRLLRAVLMTAVEEDKLLSRNPCRSRRGWATTATGPRSSTSTPRVMLIGRSPMH
ncbi:N-terminal phage integrase SAM-like domain-containing protein [Microbispora siamensis]|uniref:N-terminal phage integrase SAM-like domain-containing protein n=1 Tax=Microbispora siamensis TaxID=564413 RepID=UPI0019511B2E